MLSSKELIGLSDEFGTHNYHPLEVVLVKGKGVWVEDPEGKRYIDLQSSYSAVNWGHCNPEVIAAAKAQLELITMTSRAFHNDQAILFFKDLAEFCGMECVLPMNSGAEAVETAIKTARRWAYEIKQVPADQAEIIAFSGNFHGRTTTNVSFSDSESSRKNFGPYTPGFKIAQFGDLESVKKLISKNTAAIIIEPIQGEGGIIIPPKGFLSELRQLCTNEKILFLADEIQTGLCRTGEVFACDHENVKPDMYILGKALGGAVVPISAVVSTHEIMKVLVAGSHGSTFGGNPFACAIARKVISMIKEHKYHLKAKELGQYFVEKLQQIKTDKISEIRGRGLFIGVDIKKEFGLAYDYCVRLKDLGVLCKDTRKQTIRIAPPLVIEKSEIDWAIERIAKVLQ